jgi:predicted oxidoreductase
MLVELKLTVVAVTTQPSQVSALRAASRTRQSVAFRERVALPHAMVTPGESPYCAISAHMQQRHDSDALPIKAVPPNARAVTSCTCD